ncbi:MAG: hotdog domain-containing protein [Dehalococcoidales bacterium]
MTDSQANYDAVAIGQDLGTLEVVLDEATVADRVDLVGWQDGRPVARGLAPPGITISQHSRMKFDALSQMRVSIWAKSEHEFLKPMKIGDKVTIRGRVVDKYTKRGRNYMVTELETRDEAGEVLMRSRETGVWVE